MIFTRERLIGVTIGLVFGLAFVRNEKGERPEQIAGHNVFGSLGESYLTQVEQFIRESLGEAAQPMAQL